MLNNGHCLMFYMMHTEELRLSRVSNDDPGYVPESAELHKSSFIELAVL